MNNYQLSILPEQLQIMEDILSDISELNQQLKELEDFLSL